MFTKKAGLLKIGLFITSPEVKKTTFVLFFLRNREKKNKKLLFLICACILINKSQVEFFQGNEYEEKRDFHKCRNLV